MHTSSCMLVALCAVTLAQTIAAAPSASSSNIAIAPDFAAADITRVSAYPAEHLQQPLDLLAADSGVPAAFSAEAATAHAHESPRTARQVVVAGGYNGYGGYPGYGGYGGVVGYRRPYYGGYSVGYPFSFGYAPRNYYGGYSPYNAYPRVIYG